MDVQLVQAKAKCPSHTRGTPDKAPPAIFPNPRDATGDHWGAGLRMWGMTIGMASLLLPSNPFLSASLRTLRPD